MTNDAGGWTLVGNYPYPGNVSVPGWNSGAQVGTGFTDRTKVFKMADSVINALKTSGHGFRAHGKATMCLQADTVTVAPCAVSSTVFFRSSCTYSASTLAPNCGNAFRDYAFSIPVSTNAESCPSGHNGLVAAKCGLTSTMITNHAGDVVATGEYASYPHALNQRPTENPSIDFWVK